jgi:hypothetical protein
VPKKQRPGQKPPDAAKQAEKRARREERKVAEARAKQDAARKHRVKTGAAVAIGAVLLLAIGFVVYQKVVPEELPGVQKLANEGREHLVVGQAAAYATATPTSGSHNPSSSRCGIFGQEVPAEFAVHSLEHGTVVIWYQPGLSEETVSGLRDIVNRFDDRVILSPNRQMDDPIVATAWNRLKVYEDADPEIEAFIETYRNRGPESLRCAY